MGGGSVERVDDTPSRTGDDTAAAAETTQHTLRALAAAHAADLAAAPECLRSIDIPAEYFEAAQMDPGTPNALAEMITQGYVLSRVVKTPQCAAEVCQWRTKEEPKKNSGYCSTGTRRTATKGSPRASRQLQAFSPDRESKEGASRAR